MREPSGASSAWAAATDVREAETPKRTPSERSWWTLLKEVIWKSFSDHKPIGSFLRAAIRVLVASRQVGRDDPVNSSSKVRNGALESVKTKLSWRCCAVSSG